MDESIYSTFNNFLGIAGAVILLYGYVMAQKGDWSVDSQSYDICNSVGSFFLLVYSLVIGAWPFVILNAIWCYTAFMDYWWSFKGKKDKRKNIMKITKQK